MRLWYLGGACEKTSWSLPDVAMGLMIAVAVVFFVYLVVRSQRQQEAPTRLPSAQRHADVGERRRSGKGRGAARSSSTIPGAYVGGQADRTPPATAEQCWVPPKRSVVIRGRTVPRGMVYVGTGLQAGRGWSVEPALIDPALNVSSGDQVGALPYWPKYAEITPAQRGLYLDWLAGGAEDPHVGIGYVFLYFYGLERRFFFDEAPKAEREAILREVMRLHDLYRAHHSFDGYARTFLGAALAREGGTRLYETSPVLARRWDVDVPLKLALGQAAADGRPLPADWALQWLLQDPETSLRTPATRCPEELGSLFRRRYAEHFGEGLVVQPNKTPLRLHYQAASGSFQTSLPADGLPDVTVLKRPRNHLRPLLDACTDELDGYSRLLGRHPDKRGTREAMGLLPPDLAAEHLERLDDPFVRWIRGEVDDRKTVGIEGGELVRRWVRSEDRLTKAGALRKRDAEALAGFLDLLGFGIEPDVRLGGDPPRDGRCSVLFRRQYRGAVGDTDRYKAAEVVLTLVSAVAHADDDVTQDEQARMLAHLRTNMGLAPEEIERLEARLHYHVLHPPSLRGLKQAASDQLTSEARRGAADLALLTAVADGRFDPGEGRILEKIYSALGLDPETIYSDLHALQAGVDEPPVVRAAVPGASGHAVPPPPQEQAPSGDAGEAFTLNMDLVRAKMADTQKASALLAGVFVDEEASLPATDSEPKAGVLAEAWPGLDEAHTALLKVLVERAEWSRSDYAAAASDQGLMPGGALEVLNEWAFDQMDDALFEDGDPLLVYLDLWEEYRTNARIN